MIFKYLQRDKTSKAEKETTAAEDDSKDEDAGAVEEARPTGSKFQKPCPSHQMQGCCLR